MAEFKQVMVGSIFGKFMEVIELNLDDIYKTKVRCNHCGAIIEYGTTRMISGVMCCENCSSRLLEHMMDLKKNNYEEYKNTDFEKFGIPRDYPSDNLDIIQPWCMIKFDKIKGE